MGRTVRNVLENPRNSRRLLYNGDFHGEKPANEPVRGSASVLRQPSSIFNTVLFLCLVAVAIVIYISNIIAVNRLAVEVNDLQQKYDAILNENEILRAEINRRSSLERIGRIATEQLGLQHPREQPQWLEVDQRRLEDIQKAERRH